MYTPVLWALVGGFLFGVFARSFVAFGVWSIVSVALSASIPLITARITGKDFRRALIPCIFILFYALGAARMHYAVFEGDPALDVWVGEKVVLEGVIVEEPDTRENNVRLTVRVTSIALTSIERSVSVLVVAPLHTDVSYGDFVRAQGELRAPRAFDVGLGRKFNYPAYLAKDRIGYEMSFASVEVLPSSRGANTPYNPIKAGAIWIKRMYLDGLAMALPEPQAGLAGGITAGDKRGLGDLSETFRIVGLIHIVVLSGYNIMVVIGFIERIFKKARAYVRFSLAIGVAIFFALMTGLAASSVRAAAMAVIATAGKATGRIYLASRALGIVAFGMVLINPYVLAFDPGFQLSILATLGLIHISPLCAARMTWVTEKMQLRETAAATLSTQITVLPLILYQNGALSLYALPTNLLALAAVPYAMLLSFVAGLAGIFLGPLAPIVGFPAYLLLAYITTIAQFFALLPFSALTIPAFSSALLSLVYLILCIGALSWHKKKAGHRVPPHTTTSPTST